MTLGTDICYIKKIVISVEFFQNLLQLEVTLNDLVLMC